MCVHVYVRVCLSVRIKGKETKKEEAAAHLPTRKQTHVYRPFEVVESRLVVWGKGNLVKGIRNFPLRNLGREA